MEPTILIDPGTPKRTPGVYDATLHISTGQFSFMEVKITSNVEDIIKKNDYLLKHYETKAK